MMLKIWWSIMASYKSSFKNNISKHFVTQLWVNMLIVQIKSNLKCYQMKATFKHHILTCFFLYYSLWIAIPILSTKRERGEISLIKLEYGYKFTSLSMVYKYKVNGLPWFGCSNEGCSSSPHRLWFADFLWGQGCLEKLSND